MTVQGVITDAYLTISCVSLAVQGWALAHLVGNRKDLVGTGLLRTAYCRVTGAVLYVYVGLNALWFQSAVPATTFTVFALIQIMYWHFGARADVRLKRKLTRRPISEEQPVTWLPGARVVDLSGSRGNGPFQNFLGVVLHVNGNELGTDDAFYTGGTDVNPDQVTPNFQVYKDGSVHQYLPINWQPWCQAEGNYNYAAIETAGVPEEPLTAAQVATCQRIIALYRSELGMAATVADSPGQRGLGWHGMGGTPWGGHPYCPGELRKSQRQQIIQGGPAPKPPAPQPHLNPLEEDVLIFNFGGGIWITPPDYRQKRSFAGSTEVLRWEKNMGVLGVKILVTEMDPKQAAAIPTGASIG